MSFNRADKSVETLLPVVERIVAFVRRHNRLSVDEGEEFAAFVRLKLVERHQAILDGFQGRSRFETYISVVVQRLFLDHRAEAWGRFKPSAIARSLGPVAVRLEELIHRDGLACADAIRTLRVAHQVTRTEHELEAIAAKLPPRAIRRTLPEDAAANAAAEIEADPIVVAEERASAERIEAALDRVLERLPEQDRLIVRLHFLESLPLSSVAGVLRLPQKPLYRRVEKILKQLREGLESEGIERKSVACLVGRAEFAIERHAELSPNPGIRPADPSMEG